jgi:hypothetical protein
VYAAQLDDRRLTFEVFGVWRRNMVMRDHETGSIWQQATGEAIDGPLKGKQLELLFAQEMTWDELKTYHPEACYALTPRQQRGLVPIPMLMRVLKITEHLQVQGLSPVDRRLDAHQTIIGLVVNGEAKAYPLAVLRSAGIIMDRVGDEQIKLEYHASGDHVIIQNQRGIALPYERQWWLGWSEFHPRSAIYSTATNDHK